VASFSAASVWLMGAGHSFDFVRPPLKTDPTAATSAALSLRHVAGGRHKVCFRACRARVMHCVPRLLCLLGSGGGWFPAHAQLGLFTVHFSRADVKPAAAHGLSDL